MKFSQVIGQAKIKQQLIQAVKNNRISHAQLFLGPEGSGNLALALAYCQYIVCDNRTDEDSCGACPSCKKISTHQFADLHFTFPIFNIPKVEPLSDMHLAVWRKTLARSAYFDAAYWREQINGENKQLLIAVKEAVAIVKKLSLKSYEGGYKFSLIWLPEVMKATVSNKLLKIIEEPPDKTIFLLVSNSTERIPATILSRTQLIKIPKLRDEEMRSALIAREGISSNNQIEQLVQMSNGNWFRAWLLTHEGEDQRLEVFIEWMRLCYAKDVVGFLKWAQSRHDSGREHMKQFLDYALHMFRQCIVGNYSGHQLSRFGPKESEFASKFAPFINEKNIIDLNAEVQKAHYDITRNGYGKLVMFDLSLSIANSLKRR